MKDEFSKQELFDFICIHLLSQNARSVEGQKSVYRSSLGLKSAIGCIIKDDEHPITKISLEQLCLDPELFTASNKKFIRRIKGHIELLTSLENIHDFILPIYWRQALKALADKHELKCPI
jgi:hypothetical protein